MRIVITHPALDGAIVITWSPCGEHNTTIQYPTNSWQGHTETPEDAVKTATQNLLR